LNAGTYRNRAGTSALLLVALALGLPGCAKTSADVLDDGLVIRNRKNLVLRNLKISTRSGSCISIHGSTNITIRESQIGPCGKEGGQKHGIKVEDSNGISIYDSYIHPEYRAPQCCDTGNSIQLERASNVIIQGNVIAYGETNIEAVRTVANLQVIGNFLLNPQGIWPRGENVQAWNSSDVLVENNYTLASRDPQYLMPENVEDSLNFGFGNRFVARGNYIVGGQSVSGCAIITDEGASDSLFENNIALDTGQCGIGVGNGERNVMRGNRVLIRNPVPKGGNTAMFVWNQDPRPCGPTQVLNNIATTLRADGTHSGYWDGGGCAPVTLQGNIWNEAALKLLEPAAQKLPAPPIPPSPKACAPRSPYTNQKNFALCADAQ